MLSIAKLSPIAVTSLLPKAHISDKVVVTISQEFGMNGYTSEVLLTPSEVAALFRVDPKTVTRWAKAGKLTSIRTLGGHRRYRESEVKALLETHLKSKP